MATFASALYPGLTLQDEKGIWAQFTAGRFETTDAAVIKRLQALPDSEGIAETTDAPPDEIPQE
ncbi:hypothetical protein [Kitasatospora sp. HPMI-4]|uniref:hypothetical protein n=1 Tax=Kitasatospora sp. HPMI-4 TaxID=3448443 RepID=UPI003F1BE535